MAAATAKAKGTHYKKARESFDHLEIEQRARFLLEATLSTITEGIERVSSAVTSEFDSVFEDCEVSGEPKKSTRKKASSKKSSKKKTTRATKSDDDATA